MRPPFFSIAITIAFLFLNLFSCKNSNKEDLIIVMNNNITQSNNIIHGQAIDILHSLEEKLKDPATSESANRWYPKAKYIYNLSTEMIESLYTAKNNSINADSLIYRIEKYLKNILKSDVLINEAFKNSFSELFSQSEILESAYKNADSLSANAIINGLKNSIRIAEVSTLEFCNVQCPKNIFEYIVTSAIIAQNSSIVEKGMPIEITAGIAAFSTRNQAIIKINNKQIPLSENGAAVYEFESPKKAGKYSVPVEIEYIDQDGKKTKLNKTLSYTVFE